MKPLENIGLKNTTVRVEIRIKSVFFPREIVRVVIATVIKFYTVEKELSGNADDFSLSFSTEPAYSELSNPSHDVLSKNKNADRVPSRIRRLFRVTAMELDEGRP